MRGSRQPLLLLVGGALGGTLALGLDLVWLFGLWQFVKISWLHVATAVASGIAVSGAISLLSYTRVLARLRDQSVGGRAAWVCAGIVAIPLGQSVYGSGLHRGLPLPAALAAALLGVAAYAAWHLVVRRIAGSGRSWISPLIGAATVSALLVANRNLLDSPVAPRSLALGVGAAFAALVTARLVRIGPRFRVGVAIVATAALCSSVLAGMLEPPATPPPTGSRERHPDLVLILIDTLRQDVFRSVVEDTQEGAAFRRALGPAVWFGRMVATAPWTAPSTASIMTGLHPREHGFEAVPDDGDGLAMLRLSDSAVTLAERLRDAGYVTEAVVTNPVVRPETGMARGYSRYRMLQHPAAVVPLLSSLHSLGILGGTLTGPEAYQPASTVRSYLRWRLPGLTRTDAPVALYVHLLDPHEPLHAHPDLADDPNGKDLPRVERLYREEVRYVLWELVGTIELLKRHDLWSDALVVVLSDHGELLPSDGKTGKIPEETGEPRDYGHGFSLYEGVLRVPLVISPPEGVGGHRDVDVLCSQVDIQRTILDLLGVDTSGLPARRSLVRAVEGGEAEGRREALAGSVSDGPQQRSLRLGSLKLIDYPDDEYPPELYDLSADPMERVDLSDRRKDLLAEAMRHLERRWSGLEAPSDAEELDLTPEMRRGLEALGYIQ